jgi:hypothetical protein
VARSRTVAVLVGLAVVLAAAPAFAKKRVVVLGFSGPQAGKAEAAVASVVGSRHTVVSAGQYAKAAKRLRLRKPSNPNVAKIAREIQVDAIVLGAMKRKGTRWSLALIVREGRSGAAIASMTIPLRAPRIDARARADINAQLLPAIARARSVNATVAAKQAPKKKRPVVEEEEIDDDDDAEEEEPPPPPKKKKKKKKPIIEDETETPDVLATEDDEEAEEEDDPLPPKKKRKPKKVAMEDESEEEGGDEGDGGEEDDGGETDVVRGGARVSGHYARDAAIDVAAGVSVSGRTMTFTFESSLEEGEQPNAYRGSPVPGATVTAEVYPLAFGGKRRGPLAGLGIAFSADRVLFLKSRLGAETYTTTQTSWGLGARLRIPIGKKVTNPSIKLGVDYAKLAFTIDSGGMDIDLPNVAYSYLAPGGTIRLPLGSEKMALEATGRYLMVMEAGDISTLDNYGGGTVNGLDIAGGIELRPKERLTLRLGARYTRIAFDFDGTGADASMRDADPEQDVGGALDEYVGGYATAGWLF